MTRGFSLFWTGQVTSAFGSALTAIALPLIAVVELGATPTETGFLTAAGSLPLLVAGLYVGAWADRLARRRRWLIACELLAAAVLGAVALAFVSGHLAIWALAACALLLGLLNLIRETLYFVHLRGLVGDGDLLRARARLQAGEQAGGVVGRALSGSAAAVSAVAPIAIDLVSYLVSALCLAAIREPERPSGGTVGGRIRRAELGAGFALLRREPLLRRLTPVIVIQQLVAGLTLASLAQFLVVVLGVPTGAYGLLFALVGIAGVTGSLAAARLADRVDGPRLADVGYAGIALTTALLPLAGGAPAAAAAIAAAAIALPYFFGAIANVGVTAHISLRVPEHELGRLVVALQLGGRGGAGRRRSGRRRARRRGRYPLGAVGGVGALAHDALPAPDQNVGRTAPR